MNKIISLALLLSLLFCARGVAQEPGDSKPLASHTSAKGKRELRKEKKVLRKKQKVQRQNQREARDKQDEAAKSKFHFKRKKKSKEKDRSLLSGEKAKEQ